MGAGRLFQWVDSGFPSGAFAHAQGLEAAWQLGDLRDGAAVRVRLEELAWHAGTSMLPFATAAGRGDSVAADAAAEVFLWGHVARRSSQAQGKALLLAAEAVLGAPVASLREALPHGHLAVAWGATLALAGASELELRAALLFTTVRQAVSALVRLGVTGTLEGQRLLYELGPLLEEVEVETRGRSMGQAASVAWWVETAQCGQDRLYSRLFQS